MAWLDRDRTPALFAISTSVVSGLLTLVVGRLVATSAGALVVWVAVAVCGVGLVSWGAGYAIRLSRRKSQRAFLIVSAFDEHGYISSFVQQVHDALDRVNVDLVFKPPHRDYDASAQSHHLNRVLDRKRDYLGGIVFAGELNHLRDDLKEFCQELRKPVVFTDLEPFGAAEYPKNCGYVGYDTAQLGEMAGTWLVNHLKGVRRPRVLIVASQEHRDRQLECIRVLRREIRDVSITVDDSCEFLRLRAYDAVANHIRSLDSRKCLHAIFCTADQMGLGAVDALAATPSPTTKSAVVIGVDGVPEAKALIDSGASPFKASVVQDTHRLALGIVDLLIKMHRGGRPPQRRILETSIYEAGS